MDMSVESFDPNANAVSGAANVVSGAGAGPVTILRLAGELDASNYLQLVARVQELYASGARRLLLDLSGLTFLSSAGLVGLHSAVLIMRGQQPPDPEGGWGVFHAMSDDLQRQPAPEANFKVLCPQPRVAKALEMSGFSRLLPVFQEREQALASFSAAAT